MLNKTQANRSAYPGWRWDGTTSQRCSFSLREDIEEVWIEELPQEVHVLPRELEELMEETRLELDGLQSQLLPHTDTLTANLPPLP